MSVAGERSDRPVVVVTGGGAGIGAAIASALGRAGSHVVTMDPLVTLDGSAVLPATEETTAGRIVAAGGSAVASSVSVTDRDGVGALFDELVQEHGRLDAVINVAGITRPTSFAAGSEADWLGVLAVHLDGYRNVLGAALPIMAAAGYGRILGVTSGSGWRPADTGAYGCAKRAVAALTWQVGERAPAGVVVNALSPIAVTRMVTAALGRTATPARTAAPAPGSGARSGSVSGSASGSGSGSKGSATGGLSLGSMPTPDQLGPLGAHLVAEGFSWCQGQVIFAGGSEVAVIDPPRLLEVMRTDGAASLAHALEAFTAGALVPAEADQVSGGGSNPRFGSIFDPPDPDPDAAGEGGTDPAAAPTAVGTCAIVSDRPELAASIAGALAARSLVATTVAVEPGTGFAGQVAALSAVTEGSDPLDAVVVAVAGPDPVDHQPTPWQQALAEHDGLVAAIHHDAGWARAVADHAAAADRPLRLVLLVDASTSGGRSRAQAAAQLTRAASGSTHGRVAAVAVSVETGDAAAFAAIGEVAAHLACSRDTPALSGAELVAGAGWFGLRSHPRPAGSITFGGPEIPAWFDDTLADIVRPTGSGPLAGPPLEEVR